MNILPIACPVGATLAALSNKKIILIKSGLTKAKTERAASSLLMIVSSSNSQMTISLCPGC